MTQTSTGTGTPLTQTSAMRNAGITFPDGWHIVQQTTPTSWHYKYVSPQGKSFFSLAKALEQVEKMEIREAAAGKASRSLTPRAVSSAGEKRIK